MITTVSLTSHHQLGGLFADPAGRVRAPVLRSRGKPHILSPGTGQLPLTSARKAQLEDHQLTDFSEADLVLVRVATSAYGIHLFNKLRIPAMPESGPAFVHFRIFIASGEPPKMHSIHTEEKEDADGSKSYRAIFTNDDELEWFET